MEPLSRRELFRKGPLALLGIAAAPLLPKEEGPVKVTDADGQPIIYIEGERVLIQNTALQNGGIIAGQADVVSSAFHIEGDNTIGIKVEGPNNLISQNWTRMEKQNGDGPSNPR